MADAYLACSFDMVNVAHLHLVNQAHTHSSSLVVGVFSDEFVAEAYGRLPVVPEHERAALVSHLRGVDRVVLHDSWDAVIDDAEIDTVFVLADDPAYLQIAAHAGISVVVLDSARQSSSRVLREALRPADASAAVA